MTCCCDGQVLVVRDAYVRDAMEEYRDRMPANRKLVLQAAKEKSTSPGDQKTTTKH